MQYAKFYKAFYFIFLVLSSSTIFANKCTDRTNLFLKFNDKTSIFFSKKSSQKSMISMYMDQQQIGYIKYQQFNHGEIIYFDLVSTLSSFRKKGVQRSLINDLIQRENPSEIGMTLTLTNLDQFLLSIFKKTYEKLLNQKYIISLNDLTKIDMAQERLYDLNKPLSQISKQEAAFATPTGKVLMQAGFNQVIIDISKGQQQEPFTIRVYFSK